MNPLFNYYSRPQRGGASPTQAPAAPGSYPVYQGIGKGYVAAPTDNSNDARELGGGGPGAGGNSVADNVARIAERIGPLVAREVGSLRGGAAPTQTAAPYPVYQGIGKGYAAADNSKDNREPGGSGPGVDGNSVVDNVARIVERIGPLVARGVGSLIKGGGGGGGGAAGGRRKARRRPGATRRSNKGVRKCRRVNRKPTSTTKDYLS